MEGNRGKEYPRGGNGRGRAKGPRPRYFARQSSSAVGHTEYPYHDPSAMDASYQSRRGRGQGPHYARPSGSVSPTVGHIDDPYHDPSAMDAAYQSSRGKNRRGRGQGPHYTRPSSSAIGHTDDPYHDPSAMGASCQFDRGGNKRGRGQGPHFARPSGFASGHTDDYYHDLSAMGVSHQSNRGRNERGRGKGPHFARLYNYGSGNTDGPYCDNATSASYQSGRGGRGQWPQFAKPDEKRRSHRKKSQHENNGSKDGSLSNDNSSLLKENVALPKHFGLPSNWKPDKESFHHISRNSSLTGSCSSLNSDLQDNKYHISTVQRAGGKRGGNIMRQNYTNIEVSKDEPFTDDYNPYLIDDDLIDATETENSPNLLERNVENFEFHQHEDYGLRSTHQPPNLAQNNLESDSRSRKTSLSGSCTSINSDNIQSNQIYNRGNNKKQQKTQNFDKGPNIKGMRRRFNKNQSYGNNKQQINDNNLVFGSRPSNKSVNQQSSTPFIDLPEKTLPSSTQESEGEEKTFLKFEQVQELLSKDSQEIIGILSEDNNEYSEILKEAFEVETFIAIIEVLAKVCAADTSNAKGIVLGKASLPIFLDYLFNFVTEFPYLEDNNIIINKTNSFFQNIITLYDTLSDFIPSAKRIWQIHLLEVEKAMKVLLKNSDGKPILQPDFLSIIRTLLTDINADINNQNKEVSSQKNVENKKKETYNPDPVGDFREVPLFPRPEDVYGEQPFLYPNTINGPYASVDQYLDVHFKLLREDFMSPIRKALRDYKKQCDSKGQFKRIDNVRIYKKVKFLHPKTIFDKVGYEICFDVDNKINRVNWEFCNRFLFGSLLLFTDDHFNTFFLATVANRNVKELEKKHVVVELAEQVHNVKSILGKEFIMAESQAYFEPYFHVLKALQRFDNTNFPMARYIVDANTETIPPNYLNEESEYIIRMKDQIYSFRILSDVEWPTEEDLGLDVSQYSAYKAALTSDLVVIQGPPGTGKTFLGLKIAQALLANVHVWNQTSSPILVVCFTNHALDQFLEGLLPVTKKLVRIGGKSKGSELDKFNIRERRREYSYYKKSQTKETRQLNLKMSSVFAEIKTHQTNLQVLDDTTGVLSLKTLNLVMTDKQIDCFGCDENLMDWLLSGVVSSQMKPTVKMTITADRGVVRETTVVDPLDADAEDNRVKQALFDTIEFDTMVSPPEDTVIVHLACNLEVIEAKKNEIYNQLKKKMRKMDLINLQATYEHLGSIIQHLKRELVDSKKCPRSHDEEEYIKSVNPLNLRPDDRWRLYHTWVKILRDGLISELAKKEAEFKEHAFLYEQLRQTDDIQILKTAHVVGTTTTLAAKFQPMFTALAPKIVIVEEAAEVLEAHIIASLTKSCEHLILIGDHKQLRPTVAEVRLAKQYRLDVSLFERMVINGMACHTLSLQHRMRPEISKQLVPTIYPSLKDHDSVHQRQSILGMDKNVFFMTHTNFEDEVVEITSKKNSFEADILLGLARYLVKQGYKPNEITILATYKGQMYHMKNELRKIDDFPKGIQITVVDNFQGEENRIILLSLVRSNAAKRIGFLEIENRVCVALSRARDGLYVVGNMDNMAASSDIWPHIKKSFMRQQALGPALKLRCQIHPDQVTEIKHASDWSKVMEGGCSLICGQELTCGHACKSMCHIFQDYHRIYKCKEACPKILCQDGHQCPKKCHMPCGQCQVQVRRELPCNHFADVPCHMETRDYICKELVETMVPLCGHTVTVECHSRQHPICNRPCENRLECGHSCEMNCHVDNDPEHTEYPCMKPCTRLKKNCSQDHKCLMKCFEECQPCLERVKRQLPCGHTAKVHCNVDLATVICKHQCEQTLDCGHPCKKKCYEVCSPCTTIVEKSVTGCGHKLQIACSQAAIKQLCKGPCIQMLSCGHQCTKRCCDRCSENDCVHPKEKTDINLLCGHTKASLPCNKARFVRTMSEEDLVQYCVESCSHTLPCEHPCSGSCSECMQGRIHKMCVQPCGNILICGHSCKVPCREVCPPCDQPCTFKCKHSKCSRKCGQECVSCKEPCDYACPHLRCTKLCGDFCDRKPCYESCPLPLDCGHDCVGFCGEPCPPCRQCLPGEFEEFFISDEETNPDSKWVYLEDCKHTFESGGIEYWLNIKDEGGINSKVCPRCKTLIVKSQRFMNIIKSTYFDIQQVKIKCFGKLDDIRKQRLSSLKKLQEIQFVDMSLPYQEADELNALYEKLKIELPEVSMKKRNVVHAQKVRLLCFLTEFFVGLYERKLNAWYLLDDIAKGEVTKKINILLQLLRKRQEKITDQEMKSFELERRRIHRLCDLLIYTSSSEYRFALSNPETSSSIINTRNKAETIIHSVAVYDDHLERQMASLLNTLKTLIKSNTVITNAEREMINKAMASNFNSYTKQGHWFKCKNGHVYCITECGGAMEEAMCPEPGCNQRIGGRDHSLRSDQSLATEMDGAKYAAWSDQNNMANFDFRF